MVTLLLQELAAHGAVLVVFALDLAWRDRSAIDVPLGKPALYTSNYSTDWRLHPLHAMVMTGEWDIEHTIYRPPQYPEPIPFYRLRNSWGYEMVSSTTPPYCDSVSTYRGVSLLATYSNPCQ